MWGVKMNTYTDTDVCFFAFVLNVGCTFSVSVCGGMFVVTCVCIHTYGGEGGELVYRSALISYKYDKHGHCNMG